MGDLASVPNHGHDSLKALGLSQKPYHKCIHRLGFLSFISLIGSWIGLHITGPKLSEHRTQNDDDEDIVTTVDASFTFWYFEKRLNP